MDKTELTFLCFVYRRSRLRVVVDHVAGLLVVGRQLTDEVVEFVDPDRVGGVDEVDARRVGRVHFRELLALPAALHLRHGKRNRLLRPEERRLEREGAREEPVQPDNLLSPALGQ